MGSRIGWVMLIAVVAGVLVACTGNQAAAGDAGGVSDSHPPAASPSPTGSPTATTGSPGSTFSSPAPGTGSLTPSCAEPGAAPPASTIPNGVYHPQPGDPHLPETVALLDRMVDAVILPPDAVVSRCSPASELSTIQVGGASPGFAVDRFRWWTSSLSPAQVLAFVTRHPPAGTTSSGSGVVGDIRSVTFLGSAWPPSSGWPEDVVSVTAVGTGTGIRVDADAIWIPSRTAAETVPEDVDSVDVTLLYRPTDVHRTLGRADARRIGAALNKLAPSPPVYVSGGLAGDTGHVDYLVFHTDRQPDIEVNLVVDGPWLGADVTVHGRQQPLLGGYGTRGPQPRTVDAAITAALPHPH